jgi:hypothetical protein
MLQPTEARLERAIDPVYATALQLLTNNELTACIADTKRLIARHGPRRMLDDARLMECAEFDRRFARRQAEGQG